MKAFRGGFHWKESSLEVDEREGRKGDGRREMSESEKRQGENVLNEAQVLTHVTEEEKVLCFPITLSNQRNLSDGTCSQKLPADHPNIIFIPLHRQQNYWTLGRWWDFWSVFPSTIPVFSDEMVLLQESFPRHAEVKYLLSVQPALSELGKVKTFKVMRGLLK